MLLNVLNFLENKYLTKILNVLIIVYLSQMSIKNKF
jgi:hypothetical protein